MLKPVTLSRYNAFLLLLSTTSHTPRYSLRPLAYVALASALLLTSACHRADVVADDVTSAQDAGHGDEENATAVLVDAAIPQDTASGTVADATGLQGLLSSGAKAATTQPAAPSTLALPTACTRMGATALRHHGRVWRPLPPGWCGGYH